MSLQLRYFLICLGFFIYYLALNSFFHFSLDYWNFNHYLFNYQDEFIKRGLVGEVFRLLNFNMTYALANSIAYFIFGLVCLSFIFILYLAFKHNLEQEGALLFIVLSLSNSNSLAHFLYDLGRFDQLGYLLMLVSFLAIYKNKYFLLTILSFLAILIHEVNFLLFFPLIFSLLFYLKKSLVLTFTLVVFTTFTTYLVSTQGLMKKQSLNEYYFSLVRQFDDGTVILRDSLAVLHRQGLKENFIFTKKLRLTKKTFYNYCLYFIVNLPLILFFYLLFKKKLALSLASFLATGLLVLIGADHFRWFSLFFMNLFSLAIILAILDLDFKKHLIKISLEYKKLLLLIIFLAFVFGPIGNESAFPLNFMSF